MIFYLTIDFYGFNAGYFLICNVVRVRCDGVIRLEFFFPTKVFMFYMFIKYKCHLHMSFLIIFFVAICLFNILSWPRKKGRLRSADARWSFRTPPAARRLGGAAAYISYLVISK